MFMFHYSYKHQQRMVYEETFAMSVYILITGLYTYHEYNRKVTQLENN
jgi:hypothetical protein